MLYSLTLSKATPTESPRFFGVRPVIVVQSVAGSQVNRKVNRYGGTGMKLESLEGF